MNIHGFCLEDCPFHYLPCYIQQLMPLQWFCHFMLWETIDLLFIRRLFHSFSNCDSCFKCFCFQILPCFIWHIYPFCSFLSLKVISHHFSNIVPSLIQEFLVASNNDSMIGSEFLQVDTWLFSVIHTVTWLQFMQAWELTSHHAPKAEHTRYAYPRKAHCGFQ